MLPHPDRSRLRGPTSQRTIALISSAVNPAVPLSRPCGRGRSRDSRLAQRTKPWLGDQFQGRTARGWIRVRRAAGAIRTCEASLLGHDPRGSRPHPNNSKIYAAAMPSFSKYVRSRCQAFPKNASVVLSDFKALRSIQIQFLQSLRPASPQASPAGGTQLKYRFDPPKTSP